MASCHLAQFSLVMSNGVEFSLMFEVNLIVIGIPLVKFAVVNASLTLFGHILNSLSPLD